MDGVGGDGVGGDSINGAGVGGDSNNGDGVGGDSNNGDGVGGDGVGGDGVGGGTSFVTVRGLLLCKTVLMFVVIVSIVCNLFSMLSNGAISRFIEEISALISSMPDLVQKATHTANT